MTQTVDSSVEATVGSGREGAQGNAPVVRLNAFQVLMRRWSRLHPYNAGQVMRVSGMADEKRWKGAVEAVIGEMKLGKPRVLWGGGREESVQFVPVEEVPIEQWGGKELEGGMPVLQAFFNEELNRPFAAGDLPIRFCILPGDAEEVGAGGVGGGPTHYLAAVYDHWIADSRAMRELMHRLFERYQRPEAERSTRLPALTVEAPGFVGLFRKHVGKLRRLAALREGWKNVWRHRHGFRLNLWDPMNFTSRFVIKQLPDGVIDRAYRYCKAHGASVNDLFIAVTAQAMGQYTAEERWTRHKKPLHFTRRQVGIGTIVDIRDAAAQPLDHVFNLYLSSYTVLLDDPEKRPVEELTQEVAEETTRIKRKKGAVKAFWALVMARFWYDVYDSPKFQASLLHKGVPVVAGISNVNMTGSWVDGSGETARDSRGEEVPRVLEYLRISPTGPLIPVVFTLTTIRGKLSLCVTYRTMAFHEDDLLGVVDDFVRRLEEVGG